MTNTDRSRVKLVTWIENKHGRGAAAQAIARPNERRDRNWRVLKPSLREISQSKRYGD